MTGAELTLVSVTTIILGFFLGLIAESLPPAWCGDGIEGRWHHVGVVTVDKEV